MYSKTRYSEWVMPLIPSLASWMQQDQEFSVILSYTGRFRPIWVTGDCLKRIKNTKYIINNKYIIGICVFFSVHFCIQLFTSHDKNKTKKKVTCFLSKCCLDYHSGFLGFFFSSRIPLCSTSTFRLQCSLKHRAQKSLCKHTGYKSVQCLASAWKNYTLYADL